MNRRKLLKLLGGGAVTVGSGKALYNTQVGYGVVTGTNVTEQDLRPLIAQYMRVDDYRAELDEYAVELSGDTVAVLDGDDVLAERSVTDTTPEEGAAVDAEFDLAGGPVEELVRDVPALRAGEFVVEGAKFDEFFDRIADGDASPFSTGATRDGYDYADAETVGAFIGADPADPERVVTALRAAFREHSSYDKPRYVAGSIEDNILFGTVDLRKHFESPVGFEALESGEATGLFCTELTRRANESLHAVPAHEATAPVVSMFVSDTRHKHAYTGVATILREDGKLVMAITFLDYMHSTLYDDLKLTGVLGDGLDAYNSRHRATDIYWHR
ncbi:hypothetical protein ACFQDG_06935 [Natronoarchaeum mannanilyticum]|uniref:hypothetical protein n=1 Tax=Natronoarchaeum mannanilyticum TaxID=926360 RepID=UPI003623591A